jgi:hypothetical protein
MPQGTTDFIKIGSFEMDNVTSIVGLTSSKILVSYSGYGKLVLYEWVAMEKRYQEVQKAKLS